jgi:hypothetical protein
MSKSAALRVSDVLMVPDQAVVPGSFMEALKQGGSFLAMRLACLSTSGTGAEP